MASENAKTNDEKPVRGWIYYDAACRFCVAGRRRWGGVFERRGFEWLPLQTPGAAARLGVTPEKLMEEMWVLPAGARPVNGVGALIELLHHVWWLWPLALVLRLPGLNALAQRVYRWVAANRYCFSGACDVSVRRRPQFGLRDALLIAGIVGVVTMLAWHWRAWVFMWMLGVSLGMAGKWISWRDARETGLATPGRLTLGWFLLWPGLDGRAFFDRTHEVDRPRPAEWLAAATKLALGVALVWVFAPLAVPMNESIAGWVAMIGIVLVLHFGLFHLLSVAWRAVGVNAEPIMRRPLAATSLVSFWGERWNTAFSIPARRPLFLPLVGRGGLVAANLAVFLASGVLHELVISLPARGGFGLPTAYFALQGGGVLDRKSVV